MSRFIQFVIQARQSLTALVLLTGWMCSPSGTARGDEAAERGPIEIADIQRAEPVDFESEILPILKSNCLACHNHATKKGNLNLETPQTIALGGDSGETVEPESPDDSYLLMLASHDSDPVMPPLDNKVDARTLTPEELGLLRLWISQGATGTVRDRSASIEWQPLPAGVNPIYSVAVTPDGQFAACGRANQIYIYHLPLAQLLCRLTDPQLLKGEIYSHPGVAHLDLVHSLAFSPDGYTLASGDYRMVKLWQRPRDVEQLRFAQNDEAVDLVAVRDDGQQYATVGASHRIAVWNASGEKLATLEGHTARVTGLCFDSEQQRLYSSSEDGTLRTWDVDAGQQLAYVDAATALNNLALMQGPKLVTAGANGTVGIWRVPAAVSTIAKLPATAAALSVATDGSRIAAVLSDGTARVIETASGKVTRELDDGEAALAAVALSPDSLRLATASADGVVRVFELAGNEPPLLGSGPDGATDIDWHPDGQRLATASSDGKVTLWSTKDASATGRPLKVVSQWNLAAVPVVSIALSDDGGTLFAADRNGGVHAVEIAEDKVRFHSEHGAEVVRIALNSDSSKLATAGEDGQLRLWNTSDGSAGAVMKATDGPLDGAAFSSDGRLLIASAREGATVVFDTSTGNLVQRLSQDEARATALAPLDTDGQVVLAATADGALVRWPLSSERQWIAHEGAVAAVAVLPDAGQVISAGHDGKVRQWNADTGEQLRQFETAAPITALAVRPDGQRIAAAGQDNTVRLWELSEESPLLAEIKGDFKIQQRIAALSSRQAVAQANADAAQQALEAAEKDKTEKLAAIPTAEEHLQQQVAALEEAEAKAATAKQAQAEADQLATQTAEQAKTAAEAHAASEQLATDLANVVALASETLSKAQSAVDTGAAAQNAATELAAAAKAATEKLEADSMLADVSTTVEKALAERAAMDELLRGVLASLSTFTTEKQAAVKAADEKKQQDQAALAEAEAAAKAAEEAKAAATKTTEEATTAATTAQSNKQSAERQLTEARRVAQLAEELVPLRQATGQEVTAILAGLNAELAAANQLAPQHEQPIRGLAFSPDNRLLAAAGDDGVVRTYLADRGQPFETLAGHEAAVSALRFATGTTLVSAAADASARVWNLYPEWTYVGQIGLASEVTTDLTTSSFADRVLALDFSPDGALLATAGGAPSRSGELKIWNVAQRELVLDLPEAHSDTIFGVAFSPDGKYLASCGADKFVRVFEVASGKQVRSFEGHTHHVLDVAWRADGKVLVSSGADNALKVWDFETGEQQRSIAGFGKEVTSVTFVGTGGEVLSSSGDKTLRLHNTADGAAQRSFAGGTDFMYTGRTTADGQWVVGGGADSVLRVWNAADATQLQAFEPPADPQESQP